MKVNCVSSYGPLTLLELVNKIQLWSEESWIDERQIVLLEGFSGSISLKKE